MKRPARREMARQQAKQLKVKLRDVWPQFRQNGSLRPFHRINTLVEAVVQAKDDIERAAAHLALAGYESRGHGWTLSYGRMV
jgi:hypothetical protein